MRSFLKFLPLFLAFGFQVASAEVFHFFLDELDLTQPECIFTKENVDSFDELIISWNANRPLCGYYLIQLSAYTDEWSDWMNYAYWGKENQYTFKEILFEKDLQVFQDALEILNGSIARGFRVRILAKEGATLEQFRSLHASIMRKSAHSFTDDFSAIEPIEIPVAGLSQMALLDPRSRRLCSPTSTTAVLRFLKQTELSPLLFADRVFDTAFDIYGNWILNTAQASHELGKGWSCYVSRLTDFQELYIRLKSGVPQIVSIRGPLPGSALPYESGHLLVVRGYDPVSKEVICMDPAFPNDQSTWVRYKLVDFLEAWRRKGGLTYIFEKQQF